MAIRIKELEKLADQYTTSRYVYKDLTLDLTSTKIEAPGLQLPTPGTDIKASFDLEAISNSLANLFNTSKGERFLFPDYGLNLKRFLFLPVTISNGEMLGDMIFDGIKNYEPRVNPLRVNIVTLPDESSYKITVIIELPLLNRTTEVDFVFNLRKQTFISLPVKNL